MAGRSLLRSTPWMLEHGRRSLVVCAVLLVAGGCLAITGYVRWADAADALEQASPLGGSTHDHIALVAASDDLVAIGEERLQVFRADGKTGMFRHDLQVEDAFLGADAAHAVVGGTSIDLSSGEQTRLAFEPEAVAEGFAYRARQAQVERAPLAGGPAEPVHGTDGATELLAVGQGGILFGTPEGARLLRPDGMARDVDDVQDAAWCDGLWLVRDGQRLVARDASWRQAWSRTLPAPSALGRSELVANADGWAVTHASVGLRETGFTFRATVASGGCDGAATVEGDLDGLAALLESPAVPFAGSVAFLRDGTVHTADPAGPAWVPMGIMAAGLLVMLGGVLFPSLARRRLARTAGGGAARCLHCGSKRKAALDFCPLCGWRTADEHKAATRAPRPHEIEW